MAPTTRRVETLEDRMANKKVAVGCPTIQPQPAHPDSQKRPSAELVLLLGIPLCDNSLPIQGNEGSRLSPTTAEN